MQNIGGINGLFMSPISFFSALFFLSRQLKKETEYWPVKHILFNSLCFYSNRNLYQDWVNSCAWDRAGLEWSYRLGMCNLSL